MFASKHRKYKLFPLVNWRVVPRLSRPTVVPTFKKFIYSEGRKYTPKVFSALKLKCLNRQKRGLVYTKKLVFKGKRRKIHIHQRVFKVFGGDPFAQYWCIDLGLLFICSKFMCLSLALHFRGFFGVMELEALGSQLFEEPQSYFNLGDLASRKRCDLKTRKRCDFYAAAQKNASDFSAISSAIFWRFFCDFCGKTCDLVLCDLKMQRFFCDCDFLGR